MKNLISLGGPQQGVHQYPRCDQVFGIFCGMVKWIINTSAYTRFAQKFVPLTYWHDTNEARYRKGSTFLVVINNENRINKKYITNLGKLKRLILVKYELDGALVPRESAWLGFYNSEGVYYPMEETDVYIKDKLGLQNLTSSGKIIRLLSPSDHMIIDAAWFRRTIIPFLKQFN